MRSSIENFTSLPFSIRDSGSAFMSQKLGPLFMIGNEASSIRTFLIWRGAGPGLDTLERFAVLPSLRRPFAGAVFGGFNEDFLAFGVAMAFLVSLTPATTMDSVIVVLDST